MFFLREFLFFKIAGFNLTIDRLIFPFLAVLILKKILTAQLELNKLSQTRLLSLLFLGVLMIGIILNDFNTISLKYFIRWVEYIFLPLLFIGSIRLPPQMVYKILFSGMVLLVFIAAIDFILFRNYEGISKISSMDAQIKQARNTFGPFNFFINTRAFSQGYRISSLYENPLTLNYALSIFLVLSSSISFAINRKVYIFTMSFIYAVISYGSISRIGILFFLSVILYFFVASSKNFPKTIEKSKFAFFTIFIFSISVLASISIVLFNIEYLIYSQSFAGSSNTRLLSFIHIFEFFASGNLLFGYGIGQSTYVFFPLFSSVDNLFLNVLYETGLIATFILCLIFISIYSLVIRIENSNLRLGGIFIFIISLINFFLSASIYNVSIFIISINIIYSIDKYIIENKIKAK